MLKVWISTVIYIIKLRDFRRKQTFCKRVDTWER